jgi:hypothetical protein
MEIRFTRQCLGELLKVQTNAYKELQIMDEKVVAGTRTYLWLVPHAGPLSTVRPYHWECHSASSHGDGAIG